MKEESQFNSLDIKKIIATAKFVALHAYSQEMETVLKVAFSDKRNLPSLGFKQDGTKILIAEYTETWVKKYLKASDNRPSTRTKKPSATHPDPIMKTILHARLPKLTRKFVDQLEAGHQTIMNIENLVGELLEEYLASKLSTDGWCCCWGSTIDAVDFCKADGTLLQIKNSDNSENSSSARVRTGTTIKKWYRRKSTKADTFMWDDLNTLVGRKDLSEDDFRSFVADVVKKNPECVYLSDENVLNE